MRTLLLSAALLPALAPAAPAAPALGDKPPKWEYAELSYRAIPPKSAGVDDNGKEVPATPASASVRWITGAGEVELKGWEELADKLKIAGFKKGSFGYHKIQVLNFLGGEGWELMEQHSSGPAALPAGGFGGRAGPGVGPGGDRMPGFVSSPVSNAWLLKRRVP